MSESLKWVPEGTHSVTPHLVTKGAAEAIEFYVKALGAAELFRMPSPDGKIWHASLAIGDSRIFLCDEWPGSCSISPATLGGTPVTLHLYVEDVDAAFDRAVEAGATAAMAPADMFWGDRYGQVVDPFGHRWSFATPKANHGSEGAAEHAPAQHAEPQLA